MEEPYSYIKVSHLFSPKSFFLQIRFQIFCTAARGTQQKRSTQRRKEYCKQSSGGRRGPVVGFTRLDSTKKNYYSLIRV
ncbi:hypothetical protein QL285_073038 [Trifolium repens]|nr:hypothetical protein QL285_073038 [Trifolium repens]